MKRYSRWARVIGSERCRFTVRLQQQPGSQHLGLTVWDASIVCAKYMEKVLPCWRFHLSQMCGKLSILEAMVHDTMSCIYVQKTLNEKRKRFATLVSSVSSANHSTQLSYRPKRCPSATAWTRGQLCGCCTALQAQSVGGTFVYLRSATLVSLLRNPENLLKLLVHSAAVPEAQSLPSIPHERRPGN